MPVFAVIPQLFIIAVALLMTCVIFGVVVVRRFPQWRRAAQLKRAEARRLADKQRALTWKAGEDLDRYPVRLLAQEQQLVQAQVVALQRVEHLRQLAAGAEAKGGREGLAQRYGADADALQQRAGDMARLIAQIWRARTLLELRVHAAVTARCAPEPVVLPALVEGVAAEAVARLEAAAAEVRGFVVEVANRLSTLEAVGTDPPDGVMVMMDVRAEVDAERADVVQRYRRLIERMDAVADELDYLTERCRTQVVLEQVEQVPMPEDGHVSSWADAVADLDQVGAQIAPSGAALDEAISALDEGIGALERSGHDARAHADAAIEVERLLGRFEP